MPELPEVESVVRTFRGALEGRRIDAFEASWPRQVAPSESAVRRAIRGRVILRLTRRAKFIVFELDDGAHLLVHLRMSGRLGWAGDPSLRHVRATWTLDDGRRLVLDDARKFARVVHTSDFAAIERGLGVEPLERGFTAEVLAAALRRSRVLKPLLLDQAVVAGLGNIYTDEALHRAGLHPLRRADGLSREEIAALHAAIRAVLRDGLRHNGASIDWIYPEGRMQHHLRVYGRTGERCRCGATIVAFRVAQRGTHVCPACQPRRGRTAAAARRTTVSAAGGRGERA